jgi:hypothetical protein
MRPLILLGLALAAGSTGCAMTIPDTVPYPHHPSAEEPAPGASLCTRTAVAARSLSGAQAAGGWTLIGIGAASTAGGAGAALINDIEGRRIAAVSLVVGGIGLGIIGYHLLLRSAASARLAEASDLALLDHHDRRSWETCARAKAAWGADKASADGVTRKMAEEQEQENLRLRMEIQKLEQKRGPQPHEAGETATPPDALPPPLAPRR